MGATSPGETCESCDKDQFRSDEDNNTVCRVCPIGWSSSRGSAKCIPCGAGTFDVGCQKCPVEFARNGTDPDASKCRRCKLGETTLSEGVHLVLNVMLVSMVVQREDARSVQSATTRMGKERLCAKLVR